MTIHNLSLRGLISELFSRNKASGTPREGKSPRLAVFTLVIATLAMFGTVANSLFNFWRYKESQASKISVRCRLARRTTIEVIPADADLYGTGGFRTQGRAPGGLRLQLGPQGHGLAAFDLLNSSGKTETTVDLNSYPKFIVLPMECLVTNESEKPVSIEKFELAYMYDHSPDAWVAFLNFLPVEAVLGDGLQPTKMPHLMAPGEGTVFVLPVLWPLENQALAQFEKACPGMVETGSILERALACLHEHNMKLSDNPGWEGSRKLSVIAWQAGGKQLHGSKILYNLDEYDFR